VPTIPWEKVREIVDAALECPPGQRRGYLDKACPEPLVRRYVESLVLSYEQAGSFLEQPAVIGGAGPLPENEADVWAGRRIGPYEIIDEIGEGGMGAVYRARRADDQYQKQVAIKLVRSGLATSFTLARFKAERQILANLDHPNITRLLDGGATEEGQPYLVMDYVQGLPLDEYCDQHKLIVTERLRLFRTVCSAVQYAHQNLVIHRDIKPSNILVTRDGVPKLLDFGIAKILDPASAAPEAVRTQTMVRLLTPEYASPEQLRGENITTASDVYSLGVVLYELLTGRRPYHLSGRLLDEMARVVAEMQPEKPSSAVVGAEQVTSGRLLKLTPGAAYGAREGSPQKLRRRLSGDLDNIVLTALRKEPQRRYASVEQFSEDVRRHLEGLPIVARPDTLSYRSSRFTKRHATAVTAAVLVAISLMAGLAVALQEARVARLQRARAERRFNDVRELANSLLFDIHDAIKDLPGSTSARKLLVDRALRYFDSLAGEAGNDPSLQRELAAGYERVGDVQSKAGYGNVGNTNAAIASYRKSLVIREALVRANPSDTQDRYYLAETYRALGRILMGTGSAEAAYANLGSALRVSEPLAKGAADPKLRIQLAQIYDAMADMQDGLEMYLHVGTPASSLESRQKAIEIFQDLVTKDPGNKRLRQMLAISHVKAGDSQTREGRTSVALIQYRNSLSILEELATGSANATLQRTIAGIQDRVGLALLQEGEATGALQPFREALRASEALAVADPGNVQAQSDLADSYANVGEASARSGQVREGLSLLQRAITIWQKLIAADPGNASVGMSLANAYFTMGQLSAQNSQKEQAVRSLEKARALAESLCASDPRDNECRLTLSRVLIEMGTLESESGRLSQALDCLRRAQRLLDPLTSTSESDRPARAAAAECHSALGQTYLRSAEKSGLLPSKRTDLWIQAREEYRASLESYHSLQRQQTLNATERKRESTVAGQLAKCETALQGSKPASPGRP
jgi:eukaryotic-like serine/threonine-protein kinase